MPFDPVAFLTEIGLIVAGWTTLLLSNLGTITTAMLSNDLAKLVLALAITYAAARFGLGLVRKLIGFFK